MRIAILGAGAVGSYFGGRLALAGEEVSWFARGATLAALRERGLRVESLQGDFVLPPQRASDRSDDFERMDAVVLGVKAWQVAEVGPLVRSWLAPTGIVLPLQNGVDAVPELARALGPEPVVGGVCRIVCEVVAPARVRHFGAVPSVDLGPWPQGDAQSAARVARQRERCRALADAFVRAGVEARVRDDIRPALWEKFLFIAAVGTVGAASDRTLGELRAEAETRALLERAMQEVAALARASGVELAPDVVARNLAFVDRLPAESTASMQRDIRAARPSELEAQTGAVVRLGRELGVATPVHARLYAELRARVGSSPRA